LLQLAGEDTTVIICSDHGFHPDHLRPLQIPKEPAGPAAEHSPYGIIAMRGAGLKQDELIFGSTLLDITPTILTLFGVPVGRDMDGKPLVQAFIDPIKPDVIDSWETVDGDDGRLPADAVNDPWAEQEAIDQLVALGYIEPPGADAQKAVERAVRESKFYLARVYLQKSDYSNALPILEELYEKYPDQIRFGLRLANCYQALEKIAEARQVTDEVVEFWKQEQISQATLAKEKAEEAGKDVSQWQTPTDPHNPSLDLLQGNLFLAEDKTEEALTYFQRAQKASPRLPNLHLSIGQTYLKLDRLQDAEEAFFQATEIDPDSAAAYHGLAQVYLRMHQFQEAAETAMTAVGLIYHNPSAHFHLGEALFRLGRFEMAAQSWEVCVSQAPGMKKAHERLIEVYQRYLRDPLKAVEHREFIEKRITAAQVKKRQSRKITPPEPPPDIQLQPKYIVYNQETVITVVSGLPRSGTSMMMQMLQAGGLTILTDAQRSADESNPRGYLEYEKVKSLAKDNTWLGEAQGKVVKIIAHLLPFLDKQYQYRIIFMQRDLNEVLQSQETMLDRLGKQGKSPKQLMQVYQRQLQQIYRWLMQQDNIAVLPMSHQTMLQNPLPEVTQLVTFLGQTFDEEAAVTVVDTSLYRARKM
jgi:tetratricopeptide (TPR) repeat protein